MAYIKETAFQPLVTNHEFDSTLNITGVFDSDGAGTGEACSSGFLCTRRATTDNEGYTDVKNTNTWYMIAATSAATIATPVYACNTFNVNEVADPVTGALYKVGSNTLGLPAPEGQAVTYTKIVFDGTNIYRFGVGNIDGAVGANKFFTIDAGLLKPAATAPTTNGAIYFELSGDGNFTAGAYNAFGYYDLIAHTVVATA